VTYKKKLIEVALPLEAINVESAREKSPFTRHHPRAMHVWWARRPLAACRAVIFASLVDDPSSNPERYPTSEAQEVERQRLFRIIEDLVKWENSGSEAVLAAARAEIMRSTDGCPPPVLDPFCGGGSIPLEGQRLGLEAHGTDLNPVPVLITKALIEIPPRFADMPPVNPDAREGQIDGGVWRNAQGLAEDVRRQGGWMREQAAQRMGHLYPKVALSPGSPVGATARAWLWARTVKCPNPACGARMPLVRSFWLSKKKGKNAWVEPVVDRVAKTVTFEIRNGEGVAQEGTVDRRGARCVVCGSPAPFDHVRSEGRAGRMGAQLMAVVAEGPRGQVFLPPDDEQIRVSRSAEPQWSPDVPLPHNPRDFKTPNYGMTTFADLFTPRQLVALTTLSDLVGEARLRVRAEAKAAGLADDGVSFEEGGCGATAYADAVATYLGLAVSRLTDFSNSICSWDAGNTNMRQLFARQAIPMAWDYAETNLLDGVVSIRESIGWVTQAMDALPAGSVNSTSRQVDAAAAVDNVAAPLISTDPPYYDNIGYADLSDFFYVWLRHSLGGVYPQLMSTLLVPKAQELVATPYRFDGDKHRAQEFFERGLGHAFERMRDSHDPRFPLTVFYAFKQTETDDNATASTGWETMLEGLLSAGFALLGTWPMRTEQQQRSIATGANALASSIVLVCRPRPASAVIATRSEFMARLRRELPEALRVLQHGSIAPVDLAQAAIGPGMGVFSAYVKVVESDGSAMPVRAALALINQVLDEVLSEQDSEYDPATRWALAWFEQMGFTEGQYGTAEVLANAKAIAVDTLAHDGFVESRAGKVRLLRRDELADDWDPTTDKMLTVWEVAQHTVRALERDGERGAALLLARVGAAYGEIARDLAYRLFAVCEKKGWSREALPFNALVVAWPEIVKLAASGVPDSGPAQSRMEL